MFFNNIKALEGSWKQAFETMYDLLVADSFGTFQSLQQF